MKRCCTCHEDKDLSEYNKNKTRKDGLNTICRECSKARSKQYYRENRQHHKKETMARKNIHTLRNRQFRWDYVSTHPCVDCGESDPVVLEFDHLGDKKKCISYMVGMGYSLKSIKEEVAKCEVRCANCHKRKTAREQGYYKNLLTTPQPNDIV
jgi:hypothetical protein